MSLQEKRICQRFIDKYPKEIDCWRIRRGKTIYCFTTREKWIRRLRQFNEICETAEPGEKFEQHTGRIRQSTE